MYYFRGNEQYENQNPDGADGPFKLMPRTINILRGKIVFFMGNPQVFYYV